MVVTDNERSLAIFIDFENLALGFQGRRERFEIARVLERLVEKGKIVAKKAYADWSRFANYTAPLHEAAIELIEIPRRENKEVLWSLMIKDTMKRKTPSFNETDHRYRTFRELLEDARKEGLLEF